MAHINYIQPVPPGKVTPLTSRLSVAGIVIYLISFGLPAVKSNLGIGWGFLCALDALWPFNDHSVSPLAFAGGVINPMIGVYVFFWMFGVAGELRKKIALAICICLPITWVSLAQMDYKILFGHWFWVAGILLIVSPSLPEAVAGAVARWLLLPVAACLLWFGLQTAIRLAIRTPSGNDDFFYLVAWDAKMPLICGKISPLALGHDDSSWWIDFTLQRSDCDRNVTAISHNMWQSVHGSPPDGGSGVVTAVQALGYGDNDVAQLIYRSDPTHHPVNYAYQTARHDPAFLTKIEAAPSFDEAISDSSIRPANGLEFLYQMLAIDQEEVSLCDRVSPNATYTETGRLSSVTGYLRSRCYLDVAWQSRNGGVCQKMTSVASRDPGGALPSSPQGCLDEVVALRKSDANVHYTYSGQAFAGPMQFQDALRQIGYTPHSAEELAAAPTYNDYVSFVAAKSQSYDPHEKAEFISRVMNLK